MQAINGYFGPISQTQNKNLWGPLISISIRSYPTNVGAPTSLLMSNAVALIDTGAQLCSLDKDFARRLRLQQGSGSSFLQLGHEVKSPSYFATLNVPQIDYSYFADLMGSPFSSGDVPFQAILGWDFLRRFDITLSRKTGLVRLDWIGD